MDSLIGSILESSVDRDVDVVDVQLAGAGHVDQKGSAEGVYYAVVLDYGTVGGVVSGVIGGK